MWVLSYLTGDWNHFPCSERLILNHWTTRGVPCFFHNKQEQACSLLGRVSTSFRVRDGQGKAWFWPHPAKNVQGHTRPMVNCLSQQIQTKRKYCRSHLWQSTHSKDYKEVSIQQYNNAIYMWAKDSNRYFTKRNIRWRISTWKDVQHLSFRGSTIPMQSQPSMRYLYGEDGHLLIVASHSRKQRGKARSLLYLLIRALIPSKGLPSHDLITLQSPTS